MKTKYILLTAVLLFGFNFTPAQNDDSDFTEGLQSTLNSSFTGNPEITNLERLWLILGSDIRMVMKGPAPKGTKIDMDLPLLDSKIIYEDVYEDGSIYGEFDWDNKALSLHVKRPGNWDYTRLDVLSTIITNDMKWNEIDHYQYMDLDGYWYIPDSPKANQYTFTSYIKFHGQTAMMSLTQTMRNMAETIERHRNEIVGSLTNAAGLDSDGVVSLLNIMLGDSSLPQDIESTIESLVDGRLSEAFAQPFPLFIQWALNYSPDYVRQEGNVTETRFTYRGIPNCLQLTGARGKYMVFDNYNRLVFINSGPKGGSVEYFYDSDLTVNLPEARLINVGSPFNRNRN